MTTQSTYMRPAKAVIFREAVASSVSQPVASLLTVLVVMGMAVSVMLTTGRTVGTEQAILQSIDATGTRTIQIRAEKDAGLESDVLSRIETIDGVAWAGGFSPTLDVTNTRIPDGKKVPMRLAYGGDFDRIGIPSSPALPNESAYASPEASRQLGLPDGAGAVTAASGVEFQITGQLATPDFLAMYEPLLIAPQSSTSDPAPISTLVVVAERPDLVAPVAAAVVSVLGARDPSKLNVETSSTLASLRALVQSQIVTFSRGLVALSLAVSGFLVAATLLGLVVMRRKDFGRRRALGASRSFVAALLVAQTLVLSTVGTTLGMCVSLAVLSLSGDPLPSLAFISALSILAVAVAVAASLAPAVLASRREPIRELRVP